MLSQTDETNIIRLDKNETLATELETTTRSITRSVLALENKDVIRKTDHRGGRTYMLNPNYFYTGTTTSQLQSTYNLLTQK